jgi:hypothetical protein
MIREEERRKEYTVLTTGCRRHARRHGFTVSHADYDRQPVLVRLHEVHDRHRLGTPLDRHRQRLINCFLLKNTKHVFMQIHSWMNLHNATVEWIFACLDGNYNCYKNPHWQKYTTWQYKSFCQTTSKRSAILAASRHLEFMKANIWKCCNFWTIWDIDSKPASFSLGPKCL